MTICILMRLLTQASIITKLLFIFFHLQLHLTSAKKLLVECIVNTAGRKMTMAAIFVNATNVQTLCVRCIASTVFKKTSMDAISANVMNVHRQCA